MLLSSGIILSISRPLFPIKELIIALAVALKLSSCQKLDIKKPQLVKVAVSYHKRLSVYRQI